MVNLTLNEDKRGFVLSGMALLLVLPAMLLASSYLIVVKEGAETVSIQATADKVSYTGRDIESLVGQMYLYHMRIDNSVLDGIAGVYESSTGLSVDLSLFDNIVSIDVQDPKGTARYSSAYDLSEIV